MSFQDIIARLGAQRQKGDPQQEFIRQLGFMYSNQRQPDAVSARPNRAPEAPDPIDVDRMARDMEESQVREHFLRTKLGQKSATPAPVTPGGAMKMGMEQFRQMAAQGPAWLADNPDALTAFQQLEEQRLAAAQDPAIQTTDQILRVAARNPDIAKELLSRNDPNRGAAIQQEALKNANAVADTALQRYIREDAYKSGTGLRRSAATGQLGGFGKVLSRVLDSDPRLRKITDGDEKVRATVLNATDLLRREGISNLDAMVDGETVQQWNFASPTDRSAWVEGVRNFGKPFRVNGRTLELGLAGGDQKDVEGFRQVLDVIQGKRLPDSGSHLGNVLSTMPPDAFVKQKGAWEYVISKLTNTPEPEDMNEYGRMIGDLAMSEFERRDVFISDVSDTGKSDINYIGKHEQWAPKYLKQESKSTGLYKGQPAIGKANGLNAGQSEQAKEILRKSWDQGTGQNGKKVEGWVREQFRLMRVPDGEIESRVKRAMPDLWDSWMDSGYGLIDVPFDDLASTVLAKAFQEHLQDPNDPVVARPKGSESERGMEQVRETLQEMQAMEQAMLPMSQDNPMGPPNFPDAAQKEAAGIPWKPKREGWPFESHTPQQVDSLRSEAEATWPANRRTPQPQGGPHTVK